MYSMILAIRRDVEGWFVEGETSEPALAAGTRFSALLKLDVHGAGQLPVRDLGELRQYGEMLGKALFVGDVRAAFHEVLSRLPQGDVLHISLSVEDAELRSLRWERLCCPLHNREGSSWEFLHLRQETAYSLDLRSAVARPYPAISRVGLKALVVVADMGPTRPYKLAEFDSAKTVAGIRAALGEEIPCHVLASSGASQLPDTDGLPTLDEICRWLARERFAILHLVCHGEFKQWEEPGSDEKPKSKSDTFLYLRKSGAIDSTRKDDHVVRISGTEFLQSLSQCQALPHLTFLCSCSSASAEAEQGLGGLGQRLVRKLAMPAVVAMTEPVPIDLATEISTAFYDQLRRTGEVDRALTKASAGQAGNKAVLVPTHFSRLAGRRLFDDSMELTTAEWEHGLNRLPALIQERAPVLVATFEKLLKVVQPALEIWKVGELSTSEKRTADEERARETLRTQKGDLNELCQDFLENSFDHLAKDKPLTFPTFDGRCPFPGLGVFDKVTTGDKEEDFRPFFFGREPLIRETRELLNRNRFVAVLGGSGSGKSSLIRAGLLEAMRREKPELRAIVFPPGKDPLVRLQTELAAIPNPDILVVDQFEELFTLCTDLAQRKEFLKQLLPLKDRFPVVITMRADFLGECANDHDDLHQLLNSKEPKYLELIQPLKGNELRSVVELQAQAVGLRFEPGLAASIFDDLEGEPGAMPLLQHCLRQLWQHRHGRWLRLAEYANEERVGGVKGAISRTAEDVYQQLLKDEPESSTLLPFIFERLARIDTDAPEPEQRRDTRRREELSELTPAGSDAQVVKRIITKLADAKLVVTTQPTWTNNLDSGDMPLEKKKAITEVEVAHEALIRNWPRLQTWLDAARDTARLVERIRNDADSYSSKPTEDNLTLRGSVLAEAEALFPVVPRRLNEPEEQFVRDCRRHENALKDAKDRLRSRIIIGLALGIVLAACLWLRSESNRQLAQERLHLSEAIRLSYESEEVAELYPQRSLLLAAEAVYSTVRYGDPAHPLAEQALRNALLHNNGHFIGHHDGVPTGMTVSPNTEWLAVYTLADTPYSSNTVSLWSLKNGSGAPKHYLLAADGRKFRSLTFTPESDYLLAATSGGTVAGWPLVANAPGEIRHLFAAIDEQRNFHTEVNAITLDPFGKYLAVAAPAGLWHIPLESLKTRMETTTQQELPATRVPTLSRGVLCVSYSSNGEYLAAGGVSGDVHLWRIDDDGRLAPVTLADSELFPDDTRVVSVAFQPDRDSFAAVGSNGEVIQWSLAGIENGHANSARTRTQGLVQGFGGVHIDFFDSKWLALSGDYPPKERELEMREVRVKHVNAAPWETLRSSRFPIASGRTHDVLLTSGRAHDVLLWRFGHDATQTPAMMLAGAESAVRTLEVSADGKWAFGASTDGNVFRWDIATMSTTSSPVALGPLSNSFNRMPENCFTFVCDREESALCISRLTDRTTPVWRIVGDDRPAGLVSLAVDPTGKRVIAVSTEGRLYDYRRGSRPKWRTIVSHVSLVDPLSPLMLTFAFSATGSSLAVADFPKDQVTGSTTGKSDVLLLTDQLESDSVPVRLNCEGLIDAIEFSRDGNWLIASSIGSAGVMARLHGESHNSVSRFPEVERKGISAFAFAEDSSLLATIDSEGHTLLWNLAETREGGLKEVPCKSVGKDARTLAFIDKQLLVGTVGGQITLFDKNGTALWTIQAHERTVSSLIVSPDRLCFVSTGDDKGSKMWRRDKSGEVIDQPIVVPWGSVIGFSSDSRWLITGKEGMLWKWQLVMDDLLLAAEDACYRSLTQEEFARHLPSYQFRHTLPFAPR